MAGAAQPWWILVLTLLQWAMSSQPLPDLEVAKDDMHDTDIVLEGDNKVWMKLPSPFFRPGDAKPYPPQQDYSRPTVSNAARIFVLIAALREGKVPKTLLTMFQHARWPARVYAAVVQQNRNGDLDALEELCQLLSTPLTLKEGLEHRGDLHRQQPEDGPWGHGRYTSSSLAACAPARRIRMLRLDVSEAKGPAYARSHQPDLLSHRHADREFCLQIDAHTIFVKGWDAHLIEEWTMTANEYAVLTTYPMSATHADGQTPTNDQGRWAMPHLCKASFESRGVVRNSQAGAVANLQSPAFTKFWAAGLSFSKCHSERDVPNDPHLKHIFSGEEFSRAARLWTNGYDMYSMMRPYVVTYYGGEKGSRGGWVTNVTEIRASKERLATLLRFRDSDQSPESVASLSGYNLGTRRSYEDYIRLTGIDTASHQVRNTPCAITKWVPWQVGAQPPYEMLTDSPGHARLAADTSTEEEDVPVSEPLQMLRGRLQEVSQQEGRGVAIVLCVPALFLLLLVRRLRQQRNQLKAT